MKAAQPGEFEIVAGHVDGHEVERGTLSVNANGAWSAQLELKARNGTAHHAQGKVTLLGDLCAWTGDARMAFSGSVWVELTGVGQLVVQPAVGA